MMSWRWRGEGERWRDVEVGQRCRTLRRRRWRGLGWDVDGVADGVQARKRKQVMRGRSSRRWTVCAMVRSLLLLLMGRGGC